jgi:hypothetical protein
VASVAGDLKDARVPADQALMDFPWRLRGLLRRLAGSERGMALPTAIFAMVASLALGSAAVLASVNVQRGAKRDHGSKEAIAAADAGANVALLRLNRALGSLNTESPCMEKRAPSGGWCPPSATGTVGEGTYTYWVSAYSVGAPLEVISVGTAAGVSRRVNVSLSAYGTKKVFEAEQLVGQNGIEFEGNGKIKTNIGTNGSFVKKGNSGEICGDLRIGVGTKPPTTTCGTITTGEKFLPPVVPPENIATSNSNCRLELTCPAKGVDTYTKARTSTIPWDPATRTLRIGKGAALSLGGDDYWVCSLFIEAGELIMLAGAHVRIFFDTPENCKLSAGAAQIDMNGNANITSTPYNTSSGTFDVPGFYVMGSTKIPTTVNLTGTSGSSELMLYAPNSNVTISGNVIWKGLFAGKTIRINGGPTIESDARIPLPDLTFANLFQRTRYVECTGSTASPPNANC